MSMDILQRECPSTSASGPMLFQKARGGTLCVGLLCASFSTTTAIEPKTDAALNRPSQTSAGSPILKESSTGAAIAEIRQLSGLTWDQLARIFPVSRRTLHFWASGKMPDPSHEEKLNRILAVVRKIDRGSATENRSVLLSAQADGTLLFDALIIGDYSRVLEVAGERAMPQWKPHPPLSSAALAARMPRPPADLIGALQEPIHRDMKGGRAAKSVRVRDRGRSG